MSGFINKWPCCLEMGLAFHGPSRGGEATWSCSLRQRLLPKGLWAASWAGRAELRCPLQGLSCVASVGRPLSRRGLAEAEGLLPMGPHCWRCHAFCCHQLCTAHEGKDRVWGKLEGPQVTTTKASWPVIVPYGGISHLLWAFFFFP